MLLSRGLIFHHADERKERGIVSVWQYITEEEPACHKVEPLNMEVIKETIASYYGLGKITGSSILFENEKNMWWMDLCFNSEKESGDSEN